MESNSLYRELNLKEGASLGEIKAAYRKVAKSCHPDAAAGKADPERFSRAHEAYRGLLKEVMGALKGEMPRGSEPLSGKDVTASCSFIGKKSVGLDVFYDVLVLRPSPDGEVSIELPWVRRGACPRCLGQGETLKRSGGGFVYKPCACPRCRGEGFIEEDTKVTLTITPEMLEKGKVRVRNAGGYLPKEGRRGDLIVNLRAAEAMPRAN
ncbi:MAG: DnaJ domain-containing protein [Deltaproteobacteria bacterium]|jgi:DnaJ-class molecular chaperone|nr:DnaJ domain-containing protein [Deltaproteobacteria bacterium]